MEKLYTVIKNIRKKLEELLEDLHVELGAVPSPDHGGDLLVGAGGARGWGWPRTARATALSLLGPCLPGMALGPHALEKEMATHSSILAWRIPGRGACWAAVYGVT